MAVCPPEDLLQAYRNAIVQAMAYDETGTEVRIAVALWRYADRLHELVLRRLEQKSHTEETICKN